MALLQRPLAQGIIIEKQHAVLPCGPLHGPLEKILLGNPFFRPEKLDSIISQCLDPLFGIIAGGIVSNDQLEILESLAQYRG